MWPVSARWAAATRTSHTMLATATHRNLTTGKTTVLPVKNGTVTDDATVAVRRTLSLTLPPATSLWDVLKAAGGEITVTCGIRYVDGTTEVIPRGVFIVDQDAIDWAPGGSITLTCPDRWLKVQRNRFGLSRASIPGNSVWQEIKRLVEGAWGVFPGWSQLDTSATSKVGSVVWTDGARDAAILNLAAAHSLEMFFDSDGLGVLRKVPVLTTSTPYVYTVDSGVTGVQVSASQTRDLSTVRNAWVVSSSATDLVLPPVKVVNSNTADPFNIYGALGFVPGYFASPVLRTTAAMKAAGQTKLRGSLGVAQQITLESAPNPALDSGDVIRVGLQGGTVELHMIDSVTTSLTAGASQQLLTRSTRPPSNDEGSS